VREGCGKTFYFSDSQGHQINRDGFLGEPGRKMAGEITDRSEGALQTGYDVTGANQNLCHQQQPYLGFLSSVSSSKSSGRRSERGGKEFSRGKMKSVSSWGEVSMG